MISFYTGGIKSGKSSAAYKKAEELGGTIAILTFGDDSVDPEFSARIDHHRRDRAENWTSFEMSGSRSEIVQLVESPDFKRVNTLIVECVGTLLGRLMSTEMHEYFSQDSMDFIDSATEQKIEDDLGAYLDYVVELSKNKNLVFISNEVGSAPVPVTPAGRLFVDILGRTNQKLAELSDESFLCVAGKTIQL